MTAHGRAAREDRRKLVHAATGSLALLLRWLSPPLALGLGLALLVHNIVLFRRWAPSLLRPAPDVGVLMYPVAVLGLILAFPTRPDVAAGAWAVLAIGDGVASPLGRHLGGPRLPWNPDKRWSGTLGFAAIGGLAGALVAWFVAGHGDWTDRLPIAFAAAGVAAIVESAARAGDDNLPVAATAAILFAFGLGAVGGGIPGDVLATLATRVGPAALVAVPLAAISIGLRVTDTQGAAVGGLLLLAAILGGGPGVGAALVAFVVLGTVATRLGGARKRELGVAEPNRGRRGAAHALANAVCGAVAALAVPLAGWPRLVSVAAFATAAGDTLATEVGQLGRARPWSLVSGCRVNVGTPGAVSALGVLAGVAGALAVGTVAVAFGAIRPSMLPAVVGGSVVGTTVESLLAAAGAPLGHHARNLLNTAFGAGAAIALGGTH